MRWLLGMAMLVLATSARAEEYRWQRIADVPRVTINVHQVTVNELRDLQVEHAGARKDERMLRQNNREGLALLYRKADGTFRCEVYVRDAGDAETLEHEKRHCAGWQHD